MPIHIGSHWCLATIDFQFHQFCHYDYLLRDTVNVCRTTKDTNLQALPFLNGHVCFGGKDIPRQINNTSDCGVLCA